MNQARLLIGFALLLNGCVHWDDAPREMKVERQSIDVGRADKVNAVIEFPAGEFQLHGGAAKLVEGEYRFDSDALRPVVDYKESAGVGDLRINTEHKTSTGNSRARWETRLNDEVPLDLELKMGAGKADAVLGTLNLRRLQVHFGAGEITIDLRGKPAKGYDVDVHGGVGLGRIYLPSGVGVEADVQGGIGGVGVQGELSQDGNRYHNALWGKSAEQVRIRVRGGVGTIKLIAPE